MRVFCPIVQAFVLAMLHSRQDLAFGCSIALQLIGDDHAWNVLELFEQLAKKPLRRLLIAPALHQDIEHVAILIHSPPKVMSLATDREEDLVHMPLVATTRATTTEFIGVRLPERANTIVALFHSSRQFRDALEALQHHEN